MLISPKNHSNKIGVINFFDDLICNKCEKSCKIVLNNEELFYGILSEFGGNSRTFIIENNEEIRCKFSLCCDCLNELFSTFKIPVEKKIW